MATRITGENRKRDHRIVFYVTDEELDLLNEKYNKTNYTNKGDFIRDNVLNNIIIVNDYSYLKSLILEVNKIGVNINQIAKMINTNKTVYKEHIEKLNYKLNQVWDLINESF